MIRQPAWGRGLRVTALALALLALPAVAQGGQVVVDDRGREVQLPERVERVVVAGGALYAEVLVDIGALPLLVGVSDSPDNPPEVAGVPSVGPSFPGPNLELIVSLVPDVVFGAVFEVRERLEAAGLVVVTPVGFLTSLGDLIKLIETVGLVVDRQAQAGALVGQITREVVTIESAVVQEPPKRAAFLFASADNPPFASGKGSLEAELLARAGGQNVFFDVAGGGVVSFEEVLTRDPEVIFTDPSQVANITGNPLLVDVAAVRSGRVVGIKASSLTSTRVAEALRAMAEALHPQAFGK